MSWAWYGAKSVYETRVLSRDAAKKAKGNEVSHRLVEERIVLLKARSAEEAIAKAEAEALRYADGVKYRNRDGDLVETNYLGAIDVFSIRGDLESGQEVYSSTRVVRRQVGNEEVLDMLLGPQRPEEDKARAKFEPYSPD